MRASLIFLFAATVSAASFAQQSGGTAAAQPLYPPSAPVNTSTPSSAAGIIPQTPPAAPSTPGSIAPAPVQAAPAVPAAPGNPTAPAPAAAPVTSPEPFTQPQPAPAATPTPAPAPVPLQETEKKVDAFNPQGEEIGYDPKVKRDPYGKVIGGNGTATKTEAEKLRGDTKSPMRSDVKKAAPAASTPAANTAPASKTGPGAKMP